MSFGVFQDVLMDWVSATGASLTALTVRRKVSLVVTLPSYTETVMVLVPLWLRVGVILAVRFSPLPPRDMFPFGTRVVFEEAAVTVR